MKALRYLKLLIEVTYRTAVSLADRRNLAQEDKLTTLEFHPRLSQTAEYVIGGIQNGAQALADLASIAVLLAPEAGVRPAELILNSEHPLSVLLTLSNHIMSPMYDRTAVTKCPMHHDSMFESNSLFGFNNPEAFHLETRCGKKGFTPTSAVVEHTISKFTPRDRDNHRSGCPMQFAMARDGKTSIVIEMFRWVGEIIERFATQK